MNSKKLLIFDIDGTLIDSAAMHGEFIEFALKQTGVKMINNDWASYKHHTDSYIIEQNLLDNGLQSNEPEILQQIDTILLERYKANSHRIQPFRGLRELFEQIIQREDLDHCFATGALRKSAEYKLGLFMGSDRFENRLSTASGHKTREEIVSAAIDAREAHQNFSKKISIGDGVWDQATAANLDLSFLPVGPGKNRSLFHSTIFIDLEKESLEKLLEHTE